MGVIFEFSDFAKKRWKIIRFKFGNSENFELEIEFFSNFSNKISNVPKYWKFIFSEIYLSKFWARSDKYGGQDFYRGFLNEKFSKGIPCKMNQFFQRDFPLKFTRDFLIKKIIREFPLKLT